MLPQRPTGQKEGQGEGGEDDHDRREDQCQPESNQVRLANPSRSVSVHVLVSVHLPAFLLARVNVAHFKDAMSVSVLTFRGSVGRRS